MENNNDYINNPMKIVDQLFQENKENLNNGNVYKSFEKVLSIDENYKLVPLVSTINQCDLNNGKLVKIRCMVQDIFDPQFCPTVNKIKNIKTNQIRLEASKYKDCINFKEDEELIFDSTFDTDSFDKLLLYCIPIPCENKWINDDKSSTSTHTINTAVSNKKKRNIDEIEMNVENDIKKSKEALLTTTTTKTTDKNKNQEQGKKQSEQKNIDINKIYNYPIPIDSNSNNEINIKTPFIINIYDDDIILDESGNPITFKINDIIEFVGVVSKFNPTIDGGFGSSISDYETPIIDLMSMLDVDEISTIPDTLIPQFHSITYRFINPYQLKSLNPFSTSTTTTTTIFPSHIRKELIEFISKFVIDPVLSEYLLFHLLSKVYSFTAGLCIGNFSLNISIPNDEEFKRLPEIIELLFSVLVSRSYRLPMTLENLNDMDIIPYKDYDRNRIVSGLLQLPKNTMLILDECKLSEGKIESQGIKALNALNTLSLNQKVEYDFKYHPIDIQTDLPTLSISYGKSLIKSTCQISINKSITKELPKLEELNQLISLNNDKLDQFRNYINHCKNLTFQILSNDQNNSVNDDATNFIQEDFVKSRQQDPNMTTDTFHYWLTLSRLIALSYQDQYIKIDKWNIMKSLEASRKNSNNTTTTI